MKGPQGFVRDNRYKASLSVETPGAVPSNDNWELFHETVTITSAAAATAVSILPDARVGSGRKVFVQGFLARVNGATNWGTTATVKIQDTNGTPVDFVTMAVAALTGNARVVPGTANVTLENAYANGTGGTNDKGLRLVGDANGTGSNLIVTVWGWIKPY